MILAVDNTSPIARWLQRRTWSAMAEREKQSLRRRLQINHAINQVVRREPIR